MDLIIIALWFGAGLCGGALIWFERTCWRWDQKRFWCPTPRVIFLLTLGSGFGGILLVVGLFIVLISDDIGRDSWWNRSICEPREK